MSFNKLEYLNYITKFWNAKSYRQIDSKKIKNLIKLFKPYNTNVDLIRLGSQHDGGYLIPNIIDNIKFCFSPGVGKSSNFEKNLEKFNIKSFLADNTVSGPATKLKKFNFIKKNIKSFNDKNKININDWILSKIKKNQIKQSIFQIDIEGHEHEIIFSIREEILSEIKILIIEFHGLELIGNIYFYTILKSTLEKINLYFTPVHIHPNNCCGIHEIGKIKTPSALEVTFLNNKFIRSKSTIKNLPHKLDKKNIKNKKDIFLDKHWYQ
tara:strand:+ start:1050 stop:1850 length:801 start_codon:yes stop_codon:yes gene_type:complete